MFIKPNYRYKDIYEIDLENLKQIGINALLFDLDSTLMASKSGCYSEKTLSWLEKVKKDFFVGVISNNNNPEYMEKVKKCTDFPIVFNAHKPDIKVSRKFLKENNINPKTSAFIGDRPLTDTICGQKLGCITILVDSITADTEKRIVRFARWLERLSLSNK